MQLSLAARLIIGALSKDSRQRQAALGSKRLEEIIFALTPRLHDSCGATEVLPLDFYSACPAMLNQFCKAGHSFPALLVVQVHVDLHREPYVRMPQPISNDLRRHSPEGQQARMSVAEVMFLPRLIHPGAFRPCSSWQEVGGPNLGGGEPP